MDGAALLRFVEEYETVRGFAPRRVYVTRAEWTEVAQSIRANSAAYKLGEHRMSEFGHCWFFMGAAISYAQSARQIRAWDLRR